MADRVYRYRATAPTSEKLSRLIDIGGGTIVVSDPTVNVFVDVVIDETLRGQLDYAMGQYDFEFYAEAPPTITQLPAAYAPNIEVKAAPDAGRVLQVDWYQSFPDGGEPIGLARRRVDAWDESRFLSTSITDYWSDGTPITAAQVYTYETTNDGRLVERKA